MKSFLFEITNKHFDFIYLHRLVGVRDIVDAMRHYFLNANRSRTRPQNETDSAELNYESTAKVPQPHFCYTHFSSSFYGRSPDYLRNLIDV